MSCDGSPMSIWVVLHVMCLFEEAVHLLSVHDARSLFELATRWHDHALRGNKHGIRELHLNLDDLLLYRVDQKSHTIELLDIVNHEELRKQ